MADDFQLKLPGCEAVTGGRRAAGQPPGARRRSARWTRGGRRGRLAEAIDL